MTARFSTLLLLLATGLTQSAAQVEVEIDVSTGLTTEVPIASEHEAWPTGKLDFDHVSVTGHEGEDATGSMKPKDLIIRALSKLPDDEQRRIGLTALLEANPLGAQEGVDDAELLAALQQVWAKRQAQLQEAMDAMSESAVTTKNLLDRIETAADDQGGPNDDDDDDDDTHLLAALAELEEHVGDMDNARDLHDSLGGWPVIAGLLTPALRWRLVLPVPSSAKDRGEEEDKEGARGQEEKEVSDAARGLAAAALSRPQTSLAVRAAAALVVGTAVKNQNDFQLWALESVVTSVNVSAVLETAAAALSSSNATGDNHSTEAGRKGAAVGSSMKRLHEHAVGRRRDGRFTKAFANAPRYRPDTATTSFAAAAAASSSGSSNGPVDGKSSGAKYVPATAVAANDTLLSALVDMLKDGSGGSGSGGGDVDDAHSVRGVYGSQGARSPGGSAVKAKQQLLLGRRRALYAIGAVLRNNPEVQRCFADLHGLGALKTALRPLSPNGSPAAATAVLDPTVRGGGGGASVDEKVSGAEWSLRSKGMALALDLLTEAKEIDDAAQEEEEEEEEESDEEERTVGTAVGPLASELRTREWRELVAVLGLESSCVASGHGGGGEAEACAAEEEGGEGGEGDNSGAPPKVHEVALLAVAAQWERRVHLNTATHTTTTAATAVAEAAAKAGGETGRTPLVARMDELAINVVLPRLERVRRRYAAGAAMAAKAAAAAADTGGEGDAWDDGADEAAYLNDLSALADKAIAAVVASTKR